MIKEKKNQVDSKNNTGKENTGHGNSGHGNSGNKNSGDGNSGNKNSGYRNSGHGNSGDGNSGNRNSGDGNSGYGNSTNHESGIFCSTEGKVRLFNKPTDLTWDEIDHPHFNGFLLCEWISESNMTDAEKKADPEFCVRQGYLKTRTYKEAWAKFWSETGEENRKKFLALPNFSWEIFTEITGIEPNRKVINPKEIEISGAKYRLIEEK